MIYIQIQIIRYYLNLNIDLQVKFKFSLRLESQQVLMRYLYIIFENKEIRRLGNL